MPLIFFNVYVALRQFISRKWEKLGSRSQDSEWQAEALANRQVRMLTVENRTTKKSRAPLQSHAEAQEDRIINMKTAKDLVLISQTVTSPIRALSDVRPETSSGIPVRLSLNTPQVLSLHVPVLARASSQSSFRTRLHICSRMRKASAGSCCIRRSRVFLSTVKTRTAPRARTVADRT